MADSLNEVFKVSAAPLSKDLLEEVTSDDNATAVEEQKKKKKQKKRGLLNTLRRKSLARKERRLRMRK